MRGVGDDAVDGDVRGPPAALAHRLQQVPPPQGGVGSRDQI